VFLGDVGSVPLGFLLGFLLLSAAGSGQWAAALILPLYYLADSGITLIRRLVAGEKVWQAHASHFYQRAARRFSSHAKVAQAVACANLGLVALALVAAAGYQIAALGLGAVVTEILLYWMVGGGGPSEGAKP